jgi:hypothetical protein
MPVTLDGGPTETKDAKLKEQFLKQAADYRELAEERAVVIGIAKTPRGSRSRH